MMKSRGLILVLLVSMTSVLAARSVDGRKVDKPTVDGKRPPTRFDSVAVTPDASVRSPALQKIDDDVPVCCRVESDGRQVFRRISAGDCQNQQGAIADDRNACRTRPSAEGPSVCCQYRTGSAGFVFDALFPQVTRDLMTAEQCEARDGSPVERSHCVKIQTRTRADRLRECRQRGEGWTWEDNRCERTDVRDKRGEALAERQQCRQRGAGWVWANDRCQRSAVRDKRPQPARPQPLINVPPRSQAVTVRRDSPASRAVLTPNTTTGTDRRFERQSAPTVGYVTSEAFRSDIHSALVGTELQVSHTREGVVEYGPPIEVPSVPGYKAQDLLDKCDADAARGRDPQECQDLAADIASRVRPVVPVFRSWVRFGSTLRQLRPDLDPLMPLRIPVLKSGKLSFFVNHLHTRVDVQHFQASIGSGTLNLAVTFDFADPAILCAGHGGSVSGLLLDAVCPDVAIQGARLDVRLVPAVVQGRVSYSDALVDFEADVELTGLRGDVASAFVDAEPILENGIELQLRQMLAEPAVRGALELALQGIVQRRVGPLAGPVVEARVEGSRLRLRARSPSEMIAR